MCRIVLILIIFVTSVLISIASADEIVLENGDRLTGDFVRLDKGTLLFNTVYAGEIKIQVDKVSYLSTEEPMTTTLTDGTQRRAKVFYRPKSDEFEKRGGEITSADINIAEVNNIYSKPTPPVKFKGRANLGVTNESGNTDSEEYRIDAELVARTEKQRFTVGGEFNKERSDSTTTAENWAAYGLYDYFFRPKWYLYGSSQFEHDEFADLDLRTTLGAGAGYQFFESDDLNLSVSAGLAYVFENFIVAEDDQFPGAQWRIQYDQYFFDRTFQVFHTNDGYVSLERGSDWLVNTQQGLRFPLYKGFVTTLQYNYDYKNRPSPDAESKWDSKLMLLMGYQFDN